MENYFKIELKCLYFILKVNFIIEIDRDLIIKLFELLLYSISIYLFFFSLYFRKLYYIILNFGLFQDIILILIKFNIYWFQIKNVINNNNKRNK